MLATWRHHEIQLKVEMHCKVMNIFYHKLTRNALIVTGEKSSLNRLKRVVMAKGGLAKD